MIRGVVQVIVSCLTIAVLDGRLLASESGDLPPEAGVGANTHPAVDWGKWERPSQFRSPVEFWSARRVIQKRGIVIEDRDHIVRERYWVLDEFATGSVVEVSLVSTGARLRVRFGSRAGWVERGFPKRDQRVETSKSSVRVRQYSSGDTDVDSDEVTYSYRIEGVAVDPSQCGMVIEIEGDQTVVEFPAALMTLEPPRAGDTVIRGWDWCDGHMDGGPSPVGPITDDPMKFAGLVTAPRDREGFVEVAWKVTGRRTLHRFDSNGFYGVERVVAKKDPAEADGGESLKAQSDDPQ